MNFVSACVFCENVDENLNQCSDDCLFGAFGKNRRAYRSAFTWPSARTISSYDVDFTHCDESYPDLGTGVFSLINNERSVCYLVKFLSSSRF